MRHGEGVAADGAVGEEVADVFHEGKAARGPKAEGEGGGDGEAEGSVGDVRGEECAGGVAGFGLCECDAEEHQQRGIGGDGVVLLVGGEGEEDEGDGGEEGEEERGGGCAGSGESEYRGLCTPSSRKRSTGTRSPLRDDETVASVEMTGLIFWRRNMRGAKRLHGKSQTR